MTVQQLREELRNLNDDLVVYFRKIPPTIGNIQEVDKVDFSTYNFFGEQVTCVILDRDDSEDGE